MWILIITLIPSISGVAIEHISNFTTERACVIAGNAYVAKNKNSNPTFVCVKNSE